MKNVKVVILGSGVAGMYAALYLKKCGIDDVLVVNKYNHNFHKACSGILTDKSIKLLNEVDFVPRGYIKGDKINAFYNNKYVCSFVNSVYAYQHYELNRIPLDKQLYQKCLDENIKIIENVSKWDIDYKHNRFNEYNYEYLIDATGFSSLASKTKHKVIGIEAKFNSELIDSEMPDVNIHLLQKYKGYAWIVRYKDITTVGFTSTIKKGFNSRKELITFAKENNIDIPQNADIRGAFIPTKPIKKLYKRNVIYVGERAGLTDPLTQEGIFYAMKSAKLASLAIKENNVSMYKKEIKDIVKSLKKASIYRIFFFKKRFQDLLWSIAPKHHFVNYVFALYSKNDLFDYRRIFKYHKDYKKSK